MLKSSTESNAACQNSEEVSEPGLPDPSKCHATGKGIEAAVVGEQGLIQGGGGGLGV